MTAKLHQKDMNLKAQENSLKGVSWHTFSLFLPNDFPIDGFDWNAMGSIPF